MQGATPQLRADGTLRHLLTLEGLAARNAGGAAGAARRASCARRGSACPPSARRLQASRSPISSPSPPPARACPSSSPPSASVRRWSILKCSSPHAPRARACSIRSYTLEALHADALVIREAEVGVLGLVASHVAPHVSVLSAGEAHIAHPTQGLLDALTVRQRKPHFDRLSIAIVGDIRHSRVARSAYHAFAAPRSARPAHRRVRRPSCPRPTSSSAARASAL